MESYPLNITVVNSDGESQVVNLTLDGYHLVSISLSESQGRALAVLLAPVDAGSE